MNNCQTPLSVLRHVADAMSADMRAGLAVESGGDLQMILSYVDALPTGYLLLMSEINICVIVKQLINVLLLFFLY